MRQHARTIGDGRHLRHRQRMPLGVGVQDPLRLPVAHSDQHLPSIGDAVNVQHLVAVGQDPHWKHRVRRQAIPHDTCRLAGSPDFVIVVHDKIRGAMQGDEEAQVLGAFARLKVIIGVQYPDIASRRAAQRHVDATPIISVCLVDDFHHCRETPLESMRHFTCAVGASVIHDDDLKRVRQRSIFFLEQV